MAGGDAELMTTPIRPTDDEARLLARRLLHDARHGALGVIDPASGAPMVSRVAVGHDGRDPLILISSLSRHWHGIVAHPSCSLMVGDPGPKGDPLTFPRLTLQAQAEPEEKAAWREIWLASHPKTALYFDFADFSLYRLRVSSAFLNGGFGRAYELTRDDLEFRAPA